MMERNKVHHVIRLHIILQFYSMQLAGELCVWDCDHIDPMLIEHHKVGMGSHPKTIHVARNSVYTD